VQLGHYGGVHDEIESLKRDKNVLMLELVRLRQQQQVSSHVFFVKGEQLREHSLFICSCSVLACQQQVMVLIADGHNALSRVSARVQRSSAQDMLTRALCCGACCCVQAADQRMRDMHDRMEAQEQRQNTIVNFLARVAQNPTVLQQMVSVAQSAGLQRLSSQRGGEAGTGQ
jgi:hypothetical protein